MASLMNENFIADLAKGRSEQEMRELILGLVGEYADTYHATKPFVANESPVPVSGKVYGPPDMQMLVDSALDFWLTTGRFNQTHQTLNLRHHPFAVCIFARLERFGLIIAARR